MTEDKFLLVVVGERTDRQTKMIDLLHERYGNRLEVITEKEFDKINGIEMDFVIMDELRPVSPIVLEDSFKFRGREYWQKGRWG